MTDAPDPNPGPGRPNGPRVFAVHGARFEVDMERALTVHAEGQCWDRDAIRSLHDLGDPSPWMAAAVLADAGLRTCPELTVDEALFAAARATPEERRRLVNAPRWRPLLASDPTLATRRAVAVRLVGVDRDDEVAASLAADPDWEVREAVAANLFTPEPVAVSLASDPCVEVVEAVGLHTRSAAALIAAVERLASVDPTRLHTVVFDRRWFPEDTWPVLAAHSGPAGRAHLAAQPTAPSEVLTALAADPDEHVARTASATLAARS